MNLNQITAELDFVSACVKSINVKTHLSKISDGNDKEFGMDIKCSKPEVHGDRKTGCLRMQVFVRIKPENQTGEDDEFDIVLDGKFTSNADVADDKFLRLLNINGGAALYAIARTKIEALSALTYEDGKVLLPMINIIQYYQEMSAEKK